MRRTLVWSVVLVLGLSSVALAQPPAGGAQAPPAQGRAAQQPARGRGQRADQPPVSPQGGPRQISKNVQEMLDFWALNEMKRRLLLTNDQWTVFFQRMQVIQNVRQQHRQRRTRVINDMRLLLNAGDKLPADAALSAQIKAMDDMETEWAQREQQALAAVDQVLTPLQRVKFRVVEEEMEMQKIRLIAQASQTGGRGPEPIARGNPIVKK